MTPHPTPNAPAQDADIRDLRAALPVADPDLDALHARLAHVAESAGDVDIAIRSVPSPVGDLLLAATETGVVRVAFASEGEEEVLADLATRLSPRILTAPRRLETPARQLEEYFAGRRHAFDLRLDFGLTRGFRGEVQRALPSIPYGGTASYGQLAARLGHPKAVRAVGTACATNPLPILLPCHRVLRSDGTLGGYLGGLAAKETLLGLEGTARRAEVAAQ